MPSWKMLQPNTASLERIGAASVFLQRPNFEPLRHVKAAILGSSATDLSLDRSRVSKLEQ
jgi:hypothetical protein